jgi:Holliday junction DNA helicase RuvB
MKIDLPPFTLIGATTRTGLLTSPLRDRFQIQERLEYYEPKHLELILNRSARILGIPLDRDASKEISTRSRGTPRIANRLLRRLRDFAQVEGEGRITLALARGSLDRLGVDASGLDAMDRKILLTIIDKFGGGPVGVETIAASVGEQRDTIEDVYEPFLLQEGFLQRTPRGRMATHRAYGYFKKAPPPASPQGSLF